MLKVGTLVQGKLERDKDITAVGTVTAQCAEVDGNVHVKLSEAVDGKNNKGYIVCVTDAKEQTSMTSDFKAGDKVTGMVNNFEDKYGRVTGTIREQVAQNSKGALYSCTMDQPVGYWPIGAAVVLHTLEKVTETLAVGTAVTGLIIGLRGAGRVKGEVVSVYSAERGVYLVKVTDNALALRSQKGSTLFLDEVQKDTSAFNKGDLVTCDLLFMERRGRVDAKVVSGPDHDGDYRINVAGEGFDRWGKNLIARTAPAPEHAFEPGDEITGLIGAFESVGRVRGKVMRRHGGVDSQGRMVYSVRLLENAPSGNHFIKGSEWSLHSLEAVPATVALQKGDIVSGRAVYHDGEPTYTGKVISGPDQDSDYRVEVTEGSRKGMITYMRGLVKVEPQALKVGDKVTALICAHSGHGRVTGTLVQLAEKDAGEYSLGKDMSKQARLRLDENPPALRGLIQNPYVYQVRPLNAPAHGFVTGDVVRHKGRKSIYRLTLGLENELRLTPLGGSGKEHIAESGDELEKVEKVAGYRLTKTTPGASISSETNYPGLANFFVDVRDAKRARLAVLEVEREELKNDIKNLKQAINPQPEYAIGDKVQFVRAGRGVDHEVTGVRRRLITTGGFVYFLDDDNSTPFDSEKLVKVTK